MSRSLRSAPSPGGKSRISSPPARARQGELPTAEATSVEVSAGLIRAGRDVVIAGLWGRKTNPRSRRFPYRHIPAVVAGLAFLTFLTVRYWPAAEEVPVDLDLETSYLSFRLAREQSVLGRLPIENLVAQDLEKIDLPPSGSDGNPVRKGEETRRLGLRLETRSEGEVHGSLTLQETYLPAGATVELKASAGGRNRFSVDSLEEPFSFSVHGGYRFQVSLSGRRPQPWTNATALTPERLELLPRSGRLGILIGSRVPTGEDIAPSVRIDGLWLYEVQRIDDGGETHLREVYDIRAGKVQLDPSAEALDLGRGSELRIEAATGAISALRWTDQGIRFRFQGTTTALTRGPRERPVDLISTPSAVHDAITDLAAGLAVVNGVLSLLLSAPALHRRFRARSEARHSSSTPNP